MEVIGNLVMFGKVDCLSCHVEVGLGPCSSVGLLRWYVWIHRYYLTEFHTLNRNNGETVLEFPVDSVSSIIVSHRFESHLSQLLW